MEWLMIVGFIVFGIGLIVIEIVFVPGTTIVGIGGFACVGYGIYLAFQNFGQTTGFLVLTFTSAISIIALIYSLKTKSWERFSLQKTMESKFNEEFKPALKAGDEGESLSSLKPIGKAIFNDQEVEVRSTGGYVREKSKVRVIKVEQNKIYVEPIIES